jgi:hypothetical protein
MSNTLVLALIGCLFVLVGVLYWRTRHVEVNFGRDSYEPAMLLDVTEQKVFRHLMATYPDRYVVAKVPLAQLLQIERAIDRKRARERLDGMMAQFAVCGPEGLAQVVFEMETPAARKSATFEKQLRRKYAILKNAGIPMVRVKSSEIPAPQEFRRQLDFTLEQKMAARPRRPAYGEAATSIPMSVTDIMRPGSGNAARGTTLSGPPSKTLH